MVGHGLIDGQGFKEHYPPDGSVMRPYGLSPGERRTKPGSISQVMISNVQATGITESNDFIAGIPGYAVEGVTLGNLRIAYRGGGTKQDSERQLAEAAGEYPKKRMFGKPPSSSFYIRHARDVTIRNCQPLGPTEAFLKITGRRSARIRLFGNELSQVRRIVEFEEGVDRGIVQQAANFHRE